MSSFLNSFTPKLRSFLLMFPVLCLGRNSGEFYLAPLERKFREQDKVAARFIKENPNLVRGWSIVEICDCFWEILKVQNWIMKK